MVAQTNLMASVAAEWASNLIPTVPVRASKAPYTDATGKRIVIDNPDTAHMAVERHKPWGVAMALWPESNVVVVDIDEDTPAGREWLVAHGVTRDAPTWVCQTPNGFHIHFYWPSEWVDTPRRIVKVDGLPIDLLAKGQAISPPTLGYSWLLGHSPDPIPVSQLAEVPHALRLRWSRDETPPPALQSTGGPDYVSRCLSTPIPEGQRNDELAKIAGGLHRLYPDSAARALLEQVNATCCHPPLPAREVDSIWASIQRRDGYVGSGVSTLKQEGRDELGLWR